MLIPADTTLLKLLLLSSLYLLCAFWVFACRRLPPGAARMAAALPVIAFNCAAPLWFCRVPPPGAPPPSGQHPDIVTICLLEFALVWLCNYKVVAWVCNRGPLARPWKLAQFVPIMLAPISPVEDERAAVVRPPGRNGRQGEHAGSTVDHVLAFAVKAGLLVVLMWLLWLDLPLLCREFLYTFGLYFLLSFVMDGPAALASALIGIRVSPHFDQPWRATSLADFWGKRWDLVAGNALRHVVLEPIVEGQLVRSHHPPKHSTRASAAAETAVRRQRRLLAHTACFATSGAMHEVQFWYMTGHTSGGLMMAFFLLQVPLMLAERRLALWLGSRGVPVPPALKSVATVSTLLLLAHWTFWHAANQAGVTAASIATLTEGIQGMQRTLVRLVRRF